MKWLLCIALLVRPNHYTTPKRAHTDHIDINQLDCREKHTRTARRFGYTTVCRIDGPAQQLDGIFYLISFFPFKLWVNRFIQFVSG